MIYAEYLLTQDGSGERAEFVNGELLKMAGGSREHATLQAGALLSIGLALRGGPCRPTGSDGRVYIQSTGDGLYPDLHVVCGAAHHPAADPEAIDNPVLIVEVLSPTTEAWDRGGKFALYEQLPTLLEYLLLTPGHRRAELFRKNPDGTFTRHVFTGEEEVGLESVGIRVALAELYALVEAERGGG